MHICFVHCIVPIQGTKAGNVAEGFLFFGSRQLKVAEMDGRAGANKKTVKPHN